MFKCIYLYMYENIHVESLNYFIDQDEDSKVTAIMLPSYKIEKLKEIENIILEIADY